jgi:putative inorganic carbon (HCO3(-)) transporter
VARVSQPERVLDDAAPAAIGPGWLLATRQPLLAVLVLGLVTSISLSQITLGVLTVWLVLARRAGVIPRLRFPLAVPLALFAAWTAVAALGSAQPLESLVSSKNLVNLVGLWIVASVLGDSRSARRFLTALAVALGVVAALSIVQVAACPLTLPVSPFDRVVAYFFRNCQRARGFFSIYMTLAGVLSMVLIATLPRLLRLEGGARLVPVWLVSVVALALTYVRGAWVGLAAGAVVVLLTVRRRSVVAITLVVVVLAALAALPGVADRLRTIGTLRDDTTRDRLAMIKTGLSLMRAYPVTGIGPGQVKRVYPVAAGPEALRRSTSHLHNTPLQIAVERGIPGLLAWIAIFAAFLVHTVRLVRRLPDGPERTLVVGVQAAIVAFLVAGLFEYNFGDTEVVLVAVALMALPFVVAEGAMSTGVPDA